MSFSMLLNFYKYVLGMFKHRPGAVDVTMVRRYDTPTGYVSELYVEGKQLGMACDGFAGAVEIYRQPLRVGFEHGHRVLLNEAYLITSGEFTSSVPFNTAYVGSVDPHTNVLILGQLIDAVEGYRTIRLTVLNRIWSWLEN